MGEYLTGKEVLKLLRISRRTLTYWVKCGVLPSSKLRGRRLYLRADIDAALQIGKSPGCAT